MKYLKIEEDKRLRCFGRLKCDCGGKPGFGKDVARWRQYNCRCTCHLVKRK